MTQAVWGSLSQELASNWSEVLEALEGYCNATGATCQRARTGRQRLAPHRYSLNTNASADWLTEGLVPEEDEWQVCMRVFCFVSTCLSVHAPDTHTRQDLPPLLLADFSSLADTATAATVCVYVHVEPLILSVTDM